MKSIVLVVGTRPNFMKMAPIYKELHKDENKKRYTVSIVHTGQHYDPNMSTIFFEQLGLPTDNHGATNLNVEAGSQNTQMANIMIKLEQHFLSLPIKPDLVLVFGDVTSTVSGCITANKMGIPVAHIESGNRSFDMSMPEEVNRLLVDSISTYHFVAEPNGLDNLVKAGLTKNGVTDLQTTFYVGNTMIDTLLSLKGKAEKLGTSKGLGLTKYNYVLVTLHRPANVDNEENLMIILDSLITVAKKHKVVFPIHPRKGKQIKEIMASRYSSVVTKNMILLEPQGYLEFMNLHMNCGVLVTDSGGLQEEATVLKVPCITLRENTERPITVSHGTNYLLTRLDKQKIVSRIMKTIKERDSIIGLTTDILFWDGKSAGRIVEILNVLLG